MAPEAEPVLQVGADREHTLHLLGHGVQQFLDRLLSALGRHLGESRRQAQQIEQRAQDGDIDFLGRFDVLELDQVVQGTFGQQRQLAGVDLVAGDGKHDVARVDQAAQHDHEQVGLQAEARGAKYSMSRGPSISSARLST